MDALLTQLAESSPISVVAIFTIWRMSIIMMKLVDGFVTVASASTETVTELVDQAGHP